MAELPAREGTHIFVGKTIQKMDASACNNIEFLFTDGTKAALHIDCDGMNLPDVAVCTHCAEIDAISVTVPEHWKPDPIAKLGRPTNHPADVQAAIKRLGDEFHKTRLSHGVSVDPGDLSLALKALGYYD